MDGLDVNSPTNENEIIFKKQTSGMISTLLSRKARVLLESQCQPIY